MISESERRALAEMEASLRESDPQLVKKMNGAKIKKNHASQRPGNIIPRPRYQSRWARIVLWAEARWERRQGTM